MSPPPTLVLIPAAFTPPSIYAPFAAALSDLGIDSVTISLPSVGIHGGHSKPGTMQDDAAEITRVVTDLFDTQGKTDVVLLTHSYGGIPASESMKDLSAKTRAAAGRPGVTKIVYVASIVLPVGVSNDEMRKRPPPPWARIENELTGIKDDWIITDHMQGLPYDFNDMEEEEARQWCLKMQDHSALSFADRATYPGYNDVDVHYVRCTKDACLPAEGMQRILAVMRESSGREPSVHEIDAGHMPHLSKPRELAELVREILAL